MTADIFQIRSKAPGPQGELPLTEEALREWPSGDLFALTQNAGMGWKPSELLGPQFLIMSTQGELESRRRKADCIGLPHWPLGGRITGARGGSGAQVKWRNSFFRYGERSLRWSFTRNRSNVRQPTVPQ